MKNLRFTCEAEADILAAFQYTIDNFGESRWNAYEAWMRSAFDHILANPLIGHDQSDIRQDTRRFLFERHAIYYEIGDSSIVVLRILRARQDPGRHL